MAFPSSSLLFLTLLLSSSSCSNSESADLQQLLSFKSSLPSPARSLSSWHPGGDLCNSFAGVSCTDSRVSSIVLDNLPLNADFSSLSPLLSLDHLQTLTLTATNISGNLSPPSICSTRLLELDLSRNSLQGSIPEILPSLKSRCPSLRTLNLSGNSLVFPSFAAGGISGLGLSSLDLSSNHIAGGGTLNWFFRSGWDLQSLHLAGNNISGHIPAIPSCPELRTLDLSLNCFSSLSPSAFASCRSLTSLNLAGNSLAGELPARFLGDCRSLLSLDLFSNDLSGDFPGGLAACASLQSINLSNNNFSGNLPADSLSAMENLIKLELSFNYFSGDLPAVPSLLPALELLDLSSNSLSGGIPAELCRLPGSLKELYLQNNRFTGTIPSAISNCSSLVSLDLSYNFLRGRIPSAVGSLSKLRDLILWQNQLLGEIPDEIGRLRNLQNLILDDNDLSGSLPIGLQNCTSLNWISLSSNRLSGTIPPWIGKFSLLAILNLGNNSFAGEIPAEIGDCRSLIWLDLHSNRLNGSVPAEIAKQSGKIAVGLVTGKRFVYLRSDGGSDCRGAGILLEFAGIRPEQLSRVSTRRSCNYTRAYVGNTEYTFNNNGSILFLDLSYNNLGGELPAQIGDLFYVMVLNLGHNLFSGGIPPELGKLKRVCILDLSHNSFQGPIPPTFSGLSMLSEIDLSNNQLNGSIPEGGQLATFSAARYLNNSGLCGLPLPPCGGGGAAAADAQSRRNHHRKEASLAACVAMALLFSFFCVFGFVLAAAERRKRKRRENEKTVKMVDFSGEPKSFSGVGDSWKLTTTKEAMSINLATFDKPLRMLTFADLLEATNGFHDDTLIGSGGFGDVYRAQLKDSSVVAIKKLIRVSGQGDREFTAEMETIGKIKHRNLVPLLGYCKVGEERLLVYEFMKHGSLEDVLHESNKKKKMKLDWTTRRKIAIGAARGLAFLHHSCIPHIIHRDMKSSNVLLDENLEARVSDFGMARLMSAMDTHLSVSTLAGTPGYVPPEYYQSFRCSTKGDVYSYGVVLLELLTGKKPTDCPDFGDGNLVGWVKQRSKIRVRDVFDPELLSHDPGLELELLKHLKIACACLDDRPMRRPTMLKVMAMFKEIQVDASSMFKEDDV